MTPETDAIIARYKLARRRLNAAGITLPAPANRSDIDIKLYAAPCGPKLAPPAPSAKREVRQAATRTVPLWVILLAVAEVSGQSVNDILSTRRKSQQMPKRPVMYWLARELTHHSYPQIGRAYNRDHSTIMHGCAKVDRHKAKYQATIDAVVARLAIAVKVCNED